MGMDLWIAIGFIAAVSGLAFLAGRRLTLSVYHAKPLLFAECLVFSLVFAFGLSNRLTWANAFESPAALCWSNWLPVFLAFTAGLSLELTALRARFRRVVAITMTMLGLGFLVLPIARPQLYPIQLNEISTWKEGVCLQSSDASCGPAAAATLLHQTAMVSPSPLTFGDRHWARAPSLSAERLMADTCLTSRQGTSSLGMVRGLRIAVAGSKHRVAIADTNPRAWRAKDQLPNIAVVRFAGELPSGPVRGPVRQLLGSDGEGHAVVVHSRTSDGHWRVADPAVGWRVWDDAFFRSVFTGEAIYLTSDQDRVLNRHRDAFPDPVTFVSMRKNFESGSP